jgi:hypothetical protein
MVIIAMAIVAMETCMPRGVTLIRYVATAGNSSVSVLVITNAKRGAYHKIGRSTRESSAQMD